MSTLSAMGAVYASSPQEMARPSASPDPSNMEHQLVAGISALKSHNSENQNSYVPSHWSGSDDFDNYALHSSPALSSLQQGSSSQSSPRSWDSPEQLGPTPWEAATEGIRYPGLDPQLSGYPPLRDSYSSIPTSFPSDVPFVPSQYNGSDSGFQRVRSQTEPYPARYHGESRDYPSTPESSHPLSPCSTTLGLPIEDGILSPAGDDLDYQALDSDREGPNRRRSPLAGTQSDNKGKQPYAKLIYRAFLSTPRRAMTLQEIYQWFRENTSKGKDESKGWQNSIRHNLSMNAAFTKRERRFSTSKDSDADSSARTTSQSDSGKKSTEWFLEPWAAGGVESTTRYRKGNQSRRSATSHGGCRTYRGYPSPYSSTTAANSNARTRFSNRMLRGTRPTPLRSPAASPIMRQYHNFSLASRAPFIQNLMNDLTSASTTATSSPYTHHFFHSPTQATSTNLLDYDPHHHHAAHHQHHYPTDPALFSSTPPHGLPGLSRGGGGSEEPESHPTQGYHPPVMSQG